MKSRTIWIRQSLFFAIFFAFFFRQDSDEHLSVIMRRVYPPMINIYAEMFNGSALNWAPV